MGAGAGNSGGEAGNSGAGVGSSGVEAGSSGVVPGSHEAVQGPLQKRVIKLFLVKNNMQQNIIILYLFFTKYVKMSIFQRMTITSNNDHLSYNNM